MITVVPETGAVTKREKRAARRMARTASRHAKGKGLRKQTFDVTAADLNLPEPDAAVSVAPSTSASGSVSSLPSSSLSDAAPSSSDAAPSSSSSSPFDALTPFNPRGHANVASYLDGDEPAPAQTLAEKIRSKKGSSP